MGMSEWSPLGWPVVAAGGSSCRVPSTGYNKHSTLSTPTPDMIRAALLALACVLLCHAKEANIKFISGPEVITDLGKYKVNVL